MEGASLNSSTWNIKIVRSTKPASIMEPPYIIDITRQSTKMHNRSLGFLTVIDVSPSLWGSGVWLGKNIARILARSLPYGTVFAVSRFCGRPRLAFGPQSLDEDNILEAVNAIESIKECKATNIVAAVEHAKNFIRHHAEIHWNVIFISDFIPSISKNEEKIIESLIQLASLSNLFIIPIGDSNKDLISRIDHAKIRILWPSNNPSWISNAIASLLLESGAYDWIPAEILIGHPIWITIHVYGANEITRTDGLVRIPLLDRVVLSGSARVAIFVEADSKVEDNIVIPVVLRSLSPRGTTERILGVIELA